MLDPLLKQPSTRKALSFIETQRDQIIEEASAVCAIPAPTFAEQHRAAFVRDLFVRLGLQDVQIDDLSNVFAWRRGKRRDGALMLAAHIDTVFPADIPIVVRREKGRLYGPGIGDNSLSTAALATIVRAMGAAAISTERDILFAFTVGEEGLGDLRGIKAAVERHRPQLGHVVAIEGHGLGSIVHEAVGSRRWRISVTGPGGHSWADFGVPSAIHYLLQLGARLTRLSVPANPKTTFNIGMIEGGTSINTIAPNAAFLLDLRSVSPVQLNTLVDQAHALLEEVPCPHGLKLEITEVGNRPGGSLPSSAPIVRLCRDVHNYLNIASDLHASSTDANVPISIGIPAVSIGLTRGSNYHRVDEWIDTIPLVKGVQQLLLLTLFLAS